MIDPKRAHGPQGNPMRILHLEDSAADHLLTCNELKRAGFAFAIERTDTLSGYASNMCNEFFDVVLADYNLPGFTAVDALGATPESFLGPFILLSGAIGESVAVQAIHSGATDFLHKNELFKLARVIERAVHVQRVAAEKAASDLALLESKQRLASFADNLQRTIEAERAAIAREIHDDIGGSLAAIRLDLAWIGRHSLEPGTQLHIEAATAMVQHALGASQRIMHDLRPAILDQGLVPAAQWLLQNFEQRTGVKATLAASQSTGDYPKNVQLTAYRTIQEALTNTSKYANSNTLKLDISDFDDVLTIEITDDGLGFTSAERKKSDAFGLRGLEERARSVGGWLDIISAQGRGTTIILSVPLSPTSVRNREEQSFD